MYITVATLFRKENFC